MKAQVRTYGKDEVIFREGEPSDAVFVVVSGRVELSKAGPDGPVVLAALGPLDMFGEMGVLDDGPRSATARAAVKSRIRMVPKDEFRLWLQQDPKATMRVMGMLVERLRAADAIIARQNEIRPADAVSGRRSVIDAMLSWVRRRRRPNPVPASTPGEPPVQPFLVGVATLNNDVEGAWSRALVGLLEGRPGIVVRGLSACLQMEPGADQAQVNAAALKARQLLAREEILDLLVWGDVHADGYSLRFTAGAAVDDDRPGSFSPFFTLELPGDHESPSTELLYVSVLAAIEPLTDAQRVLQRQLLPAAFHATPGFPAGLPVAWNLEQQRTGLTCHGHAAATVAAIDGDEWYERAAESYRAAILRLPRGEHGLDEALLRKHLGGVLQALGDRRREPAWLEQAVEEFRGAVECLVRAAYPQEWASAQNRLGLGLYKLDLLTGKPELLKEALTAFQAALQVFTRGDAPARWADVMNNLAAVLQVYGDQMKNPEVLQRAVDACRATLEFRSRNRTPLGWAASQNTLGTALFLLDKHSQSIVHLDEAAAAFTAALEVYRQLGASRQAMVAEKNLAHVERLNKVHGERRVVMPDWADD